MRRSLIFTLFFVLLLLTVTSCSQKVEMSVVPIETENITQVLSTATETAITTPTSTLAPTIESNDYEACGSGDLNEVPYYFPDDKGNISPTQIIRRQWTTDSVREYISVITCLLYDEGWVSNPDEVEDGYENVIVFFDKYGKGHQYRIIIGGHYIDPYDPEKRDITGMINGVNEKLYWVDEWIAETEYYFLQTGVRQMGVDIYLDDTDGDLSKVLSQVYQFRETNLQIADALAIGEGYPDEVPDGFFLFATKSWLILEDN